MSIPAKPAIIILITIATAITPPRAELLNHAQESPPIINAIIIPLSKAIENSLRTILFAFVVVRSRVASARTVTVMVWVPALPPIEATIGINTAKATICSIVASNRAIIMDANMAVAKLITNQMTRFFDASMTLSVI